MPTDSISIIRDSINTNQPFSYLCLKELLQYFIHNKVAINENKSLMLNIRLNSAIPL